MDRRDFEYVVLTALARMNGHLIAIKRELGIMAEADTDLATEIGDLKTDVQNATTVNASAIALLSGLSSQLAAALAAAAAAGATADQLASLDALRAQLETNTTGLADAIITNTPQGGPPAGTQGVDGAPQGQSAGDDTTTVVDDPGAGSTIQP